MRAARLAAGVVVLAGLYLTSLYSYNLFHVLVEFFGIVVAASVFVLAWNTRGFSSNTYLLWLGSAFVFVAGVDLLHTLAYQGLSVFPGYSTNLPTQLWLVARYLQVLGFLVAPFLVGRRPRAVWYLGGLGALTLALVILVFTRAFPTAFVQGQGLTTFKAVSEYAMCALLLVALWLLVRMRGAFARGVFLLLAAAIGTTVVSELLFTLYRSPFGPANLVGHLFKLITFYLVYKAVIETALVRPYALLFRELKESEEALREEEHQQRHIADVLQEALLTTPQSVPGVAFGHLYRPATVGERVGGDFYDLFALRNGSVGILIGDVSGHGLEAAAFTSLARDTIKAFALEGQEPAAALQKANLVSVHSRGAGQPRPHFLTAFYAVLDLEGGRLRYAAAGHPPALIRRADGSIDWLEVRSPVIGVFPDASYHDSETPLAPGDLLLLYTDGLTESRRGNEFFGEEGLARAMAEGASVPAEDLPVHLYELVSRFCAGAFTDDLAVLALAPKQERRPPL